MKETLSLKLLNTLEKGRSRLDEEALTRICRYVKSQQTEQGGFVNKSGRPDLYYTLFGWMLSYVLGIRIDIQKMDSYLSVQNPSEMDLIHYAAYERCRIIRQLYTGRKWNVWLKTLFTSPVKQIEEFRQIPHNDPSAPYTRFIWFSLQEDRGDKIQDKNKYLSSLQAYHIPTGGYTNIIHGINASTNATVAALAIRGQLEGYKVNNDIHYLQCLQTDSGGFAAAVYSPIPDMLSTATSLFMLKCYSLKPVVSPTDFIEAHWLDNGGFAATLLEESSDVEYTFYGLLALGSL